MKVLVISDIHSNWEALQAVLEEAQGTYDEIVCCGDLVGYNASPAAVLDWTRQHCRVVTRGNHDKVVAGIDSLEWFNEVAQAAARWTIEQLSEEQLGYLKELPIGPLKLKHFHLWHGSPRDEDEYLMGPREAVPSFEFLELPLGFFGHTHVQGIFFSKQRRMSAMMAVPKRERQVTIELEPDTMYMVNPGSVGQPRDGDPRAAYALFDSEEKIVVLHRVEYPVQTSAREIREAGLPEVLAERLFHGY